VWYLSEGVGNATRWKRGQCAVAPPDAFDVIGLINSSVFVQRVRNAALLPPRWERGVVNADVIPALYISVHIEAANYNQLAPRQTKTSANATDNVERRKNQELAENRGQS
jgi:hypothetical protein